MSYYFNLISAEHAIVFNFKYIFYKMAILIIISYLLMMDKFCIFGLVTLLVGFMGANGLNQHTPKWVASNYVQSGSKAVINNVLTGNTSTPTASITFHASFLDQPKLGYGILGY